MNCSSFSNGVLKKTRVDFTRIENLIAKVDEQQPQYQELNNGRQNENIPPTLYPCVGHVPNTAGIVIRRYPDLPRAEPVAHEIFREQAQPTKSFRGYEVEQLRVLNERLAKSKIIYIAERKALSKVIGLSPNQIKNWFETRRYRRVRGATESPKKTKYKYYSSTQTSVLKERFAKSERICIQERREMGVKIDLTEKQIKYWFFHRRQKVSKDARKAESSQNSR